MNPAAARRHVGSPGWSVAEPRVEEGKEFTARGSLQKIEKYGESDGRIESRKKRSESSELKIDRSIIG
jgi:hypothetical protein